MTTARARELRRDPPEPERRLWAALFNLRQQGYHFRRQHPIGPFYTDFACVKAKLVIEVDGVTHTSATDIVYDQERDAYLRSRGFHVLHFWNSDVMDNADGVLQVIADYLASVPQLPPTPDPSPSEGGGRPRLRKQRYGLRDLNNRTGAEMSSPSPVGGGDRGGGPQPQHFGQPQKPLSPLRRADHR